MKLFGDRLEATKNYSTEYLKIFEREISSKEKKI